MLYTLTLIRTIVFALLVFACYEYAARGSEVEILVPTEVSVDTYKHEGTTHDPYIYPNDADLSYGAVFRTNLDLVRHGSWDIYFNSGLHFDQSDRTGKIIHAGWQYEAGTTLFRTWGGTSIQVYKAHHSRHVLDVEREGMHFPNSDIVGIRWILLKKE